MAATARDEDGWRDRVEYMRTTMRVKISDAEAGDIATYLNSIFGMDSNLPKSPADLPGYQKVAQSFSDAAMRIVYVEYEVGGKFPWSAVPDKTGKVWIPYNGPINKVARLDPNTGVLEDFPVSSPDILRIHSAYPAPDGTVWFSEQFKNKIGHLDPKTKEVTEYEAPPGGSTHTIRVDSKGTVWSTGNPLNRFDPETHKFTGFKADTGSFYGITIDKSDNVWAGGLRDDGKLYRVTRDGGGVVLAAADQGRAPTHQRWLLMAAYGVGSIFRERQPDSTPRPKRLRNTTSAARGPVHTHSDLQAMAKFGTARTTWTKWAASIRKPGRSWNILSRIRKIHCENSSLTIRAACGMEARRTTGSDTSI